jgi:hypothetical protein
MRCVFLSALAFVLYLYAEDAPDTVWAEAPDPLSPATVVRFTLIREEPVASGAYQVRCTISGKTVIKRIVIIQ